MSIEFRRIIIIKGRSDVTDIVVDKILKEIRKDDRVSVETYQEDTHTR